VFHLQTTAFVMTSLPLLYFAVVAFLGCSAFLSASETALFSIPRERIVYFGDKGGRRYYWVCQLLNNGQQTLLMILLGNLFVNITIVGLVNSAVLRLHTGSPVVVTMTAATGVIVIFGEMLPKNIALKHNERIALLCAPVLSAMIWCCRPMLHLIYAVNSFFLASLSRRLRRPSPFVTIDELKSGIIASRDRGAISVEEQDIIVRLLDRGTEPVHRFMVHRTALLMLGSDVTVAVAREKIAGIGEPFIVVYDRDRTAQVIGMVSVAVLLRSEPAAVLGILVEPLLWVSNTMEIAEAIGVLLEKGGELAGVTDEYGSFEGVVTLSYSLFRVISPLLQQPETLPAANGAVRSKVFSGAARVDTMDGWLPPLLRTGDRKSGTLNGLLTNYLGAIPQSGDKFAIDGWNFYIIKANPMKIESVLLRKKEVL
jgi:putative hemolysin